MDVKKKTQNAMDEARTLILGAQILVGCFYRTVFEPGYDKMPRASQWLLLVALCFILFAIVMFILPAPYHRIAEKGQDSQELNSFVRKVMSAALVPFAASLGLSIYLAVLMVSSAWVAIASGVLVTVLALCFWYGIRRKRSARARHAREEGLWQATRQS
jgi:cytochrome bd-type quinol oxidase subunit 2